MNHERTCDSDISSELQDQLRNLQERYEKLLCNLFELVQDIEGSYRAQTEVLDRTYESIRISDQLRETFQDLLFQAEGIVGSAIGLAQDAQICSQTISPLSRDPMKYLG